MAYSKKKLDRIMCALYGVAESTDRVANARLAAGVMYKGDVVSIGTNQHKTHPFQAQFAKHVEAIYLHAETDAIKKALRLLHVDELSKCTMIICRIKQDGSYGLARPCDGCMKAIATFGIKEVMYTSGERSNLVCL